VHLDNGKIQSNEGHSFIYQASSKYSNRAVILCLDKMERILSGPQFPDLIKQVAALGRSLSTQMIHLGIVILASLGR